MNVTTLKQFAPNMKCDSTQLLKAVELAIEKAQLNTPRRLRYFMAQTYHETRGYEKFEEDLYYTTGSRLAEVFPTRISETPKAGFALASDYLRNPQKLANLVYANRYGNGDSASNDGWRFRGQGCIHLTFKDNFRACSTSMYGDDRLVTNPELIQTIEAGMLSAAFFWNKNGLNALADQDMFTEVSRRIQGSVSTVQKRLAVLKIANQLF